VSKLNARAEWAWRVTESIPSTGKGRSRYGTVARKLPSYLQTNGLGQTLAFLYSKAEAGNPKATVPAKETGDGLMLLHLGAWLQGKRPPPAPQEGASKTLNLMVNANDVMRWLTSLDAEAYRAASHEARECALWLRRFAEGRIEGDAE
jgi:CRISPR-associated protein Cmr5